METKFAPAERTEMKELYEEFRFIKQIEYIEKLIDSLPYIGAILDKNRQLVFANERLLEILNLKSIESILGQRPGEILHCIHADKEIGGCGTSENCSVCGAVSCILKAQKTNLKTNEECRITSKINDEIISYDFNVTTTPFIWQNEIFYVFSLIDISSEKRRRAMERIFFHDVINTAGTMNGFIDLLKNERDLNKIHEFIDVLDMLNRDLTNDILSQRDLSSAEIGELEINIDNLNSGDIIEYTIAQISRHEVAKNKTIIRDPHCESIGFRTDGALLRRILVNMLKNALEATPQKGKISIGCQSEGTYLRFWVKNDKVIPKDSQLQIFQRSYSTKGANRGLGTYSMKLLGEQYLKGKVGFISDSTMGTTFSISIPIRPWSEEN